jgi:ATP-binding cassette, subfamily C (CFTR/MRP), member 4
MIGDKILKLDNNKLKEDSSEGEILNCLSSDLELLHMISYTFYFPTTPFLAAFIIIILYYLFAPAGLVGVGISLVHIPLIFGISLLSDSYKNKANGFEDCRLKQIRFFIENIKMLKMNVLEEYFASIIKESRRQEISAYLKSGNINSVIIVCGFCGFILSIFCSLYVHLHGGNSLDLGKISLLVFILFYTSNFISFSNSYAFMIILLYAGSMKRVGEVLLLEEKVSKSEDSNVSGQILFTNASITYKHSSETSTSKFSPTKLSSSKVSSEKSKQKPSALYKDSLSSVNLKISPQQLNLIIGPTASGKSTLLLSILGEVNLSFGSI